ncbi:hypothetical protein N7475_000276 [Penicillium sp. IBT 31633x]|nr:hypothetical protein N7475_000276 [Penicillium sp. IBT 31633x]
MSNRHCVTYFGLVALSARFSSSYYVYMVLLHPIGYIENSHFWRILIIQQKVLDCGRYKDLAWDLTREPAAIGLIAAVDLGS